MRANSASFRDDARFARGRERRIAKLGTIPAFYS
jgi:hypothetical protein